MIRWEMMAVCAALALCGCDETTRDDGGTSTGPLYALTATVFTDDSSTGYVALVPSLEASTTIDYTQVIEVPGGGALAAPEQQGVFFVGSGESPTIRRYDIDASGRIQPGPVMSLAGLGFESAWFYQGQIVFMSETKAYYFDGFERQIVIWNPRDMEIIDSIPITGLDRSGFDFFFADSVIVDGDRILTSVAWRSVDNYAVGAGTALLVFDTRTDMVTSIEPDSRCGDMYAWVRGEDGSYYFASGRHNAALHRINPAVAVEPCMVRVLPGADRFDPSFLVRLEDAVGSPAGNLIGSDSNSGLVAGLDEAAFGVPITASTDLFELRNSEAWRWWRLQLGGMVASRADELPFNAGGQYSVDGAAVTTVPTADYANTTFYLPAGDGTFRAGLQVRGSPYGVARIR